MSFIWFFARKNVVIDSRKIEKGSLFSFSGDSYNAAEKAKKPLKMVRWAVIIEDEKYSDPDNNIFMLLLL
jgi:UDP-N-acetylmuramoyl-tripeptide--D-alanyl-D-alanine ligase